MLRLNQDAEEEAQAAETNRFLTFLVGQESYALSIDYVSEIIQLQPVVHVPQQKAYVKGIINLRGRIIPVIDLGLRLNGVENQPTARTCVVITEVGDDVVGLVVDTVSEVADIRAEDISPMQSGGNSCVCGVAHAGDTVRMVLDCGAVLGQEKFDPFNSPLLTSG